jgi:hypothetical protein
MPWTRGGSAVRRAPWVGQPIQVDQVGDQRDVLAEHVWRTGRLRSSMLSMFNASIPINATFASAIASAKPFVR